MSGTCGWPSDDRRGNYSKCRETYTRNTDHRGRSGDDSGSSIDFFYLNLQLLDSDGEAVDSLSYSKGNWTQPATITSTKDKSYGESFMFDGSAAATGVRYLYWEDGGYDPIYDTGEGSVSTRAMIAQRRPVEKTSFVLAIAVRCDAHFTTPAPHHTTPHPTTTHHYHHHTPPSRELWTLVQKRTGRGTARAGDISPKLRSNGDAGS